MGLYLLKFTLKDTNLQGNEFLLWHTHVYTLKCTVYLGIVLSQLHFCGCDTRNR